MAKLHSSITNKLDEVLILISNYKKNKMQRIDSCIVCILYSVKFAGYGVYRKVSGFQDTV